MFPGLRTVGEPLFASVDIERAERATFYSAAEEHLGSIARRPVPPKGNALLATFAEYSCPALDLRLGSPGRTQITPGRHGAGLQARCVIPLEGNAEWLFYSARTWPPMQPARGFVRRSSRMASLDTLILVVELDHDVEVWASVALQAELARVWHNLDLLARMPERINDDLYLRARYLTRHMQRVWSIRSHRACRHFDPRRP